MGLEGHLKIGAKTFKTKNVGTVVAFASALAASYFGFEGTDQMMEYAGLDHGYLRTLIDVAGTFGSSVVGYGAGTIFGSFLPGGRRY